MDENLPEEDEEAAENQFDRKAVEAAANDAEGVARKAGHDNKKWLFTLFNISFSSCFLTESINEWYGYFLVVL